MTELARVTQTTNSCYSPPRIFDQIARTRIELTLKIFRAAREKLLQSRENYFTYYITGTPCSYAINRTTFKTFYKTACIEYRIASAILRATYKDFFLLHKIRIKTNERSKPR